MLVASRVEIAELAIELDALGLAARAAIVELGERRGGGVGGQLRPREQRAGLAEPARELAVAVGTACQLVEPVLEMREPEGCPVVRLARGLAAVLRGAALGRRDRLAGPRIAGGRRQRGELAIELGDA